MAEDEGEPLSVSERIKALSRNSGNASLAHTRPVPSTSKSGSNSRQRTDTDPLQNGPVDHSLDRFVPLAPSPVSSRPQSPTPTRATSPTAVSMGELASALRPRAGSSASSLSSLSVRSPRASASASPSLMAASASRVPPKPALSLATAQAAPQPARTEPSNLIQFTPVEAKASSSVPWAGKVVVSPASPQPDRKSSGTFRSTQAPPLPTRKPVVDPLRAPSLPPRPGHGHTSSMNSISLSDGGSEAGEEDAARKRYEAVFESLRLTGRQTVPGHAIARVWARSRLDRSLLRSIWTECDPSGKGQLDVDGFCRGMARIDAELGKRT